MMRGQGTSRPVTTPRRIPFATLAALTPAALLAVVAVGCGGASPSGAAGSDDAVAAERRTGDAGAEIPFDPTVFGIESWKDSVAGGEPAEPDPEEGSTEEARPDIVPGFRIQVATTIDIDHANGLRDTLSAALPEEWVYVVHHPPYYKVRVGNFLERFAAGETIERMKRLGYPDVWVVPDRIYRDLPPPSALPPPALPPSEPASADTASPGDGGHR